MTIRKLLQFVVLGFGLAFMGGAQAADTIKPFVLASVSKGDFMSKVQDVEAALKAAGFQLWW
ncbi:MAG: hypothetical protein P8011_06950 [Acidihalobacter sp.]